MAYIKQINVGGTAYDIKAAADASGNIIADTYVKKSGDTITGTLMLTKSQDASPSESAQPALIVGGPVDTYHIEIDNNEILAKSNETTVDTLFLQDGNGLVQIAGNQGLRLTKGNTVLRFADRLKGTVPTGLGNAYRNIQFAGSDNALVGLVESAWSANGETRMVMRVYNSLVTATADILQLELIWPQEADKNPYAVLGRRVNGSWVSPQDTDGAVLRNISYGTADPSGGANGQLYIQYYD